MIDREKVIGLLQETAEYFRECRSNASFASKAENHFWELQNAANEAVELLKEQEAKCLTKDELVELHEQQFVWVEGQVGYLYCVRIIGICAGKNGVTDIQFDTPASFVEFSTQIYGVSYRIWTAEPTGRIYHVFRWLYFRHLMPQKVWFFVYDRLHSKVDDQWRGERKAK